MKRQIPTIALVCLLAQPVLAADWPYWRGPNSNGIAPAGPAPPLVWDQSANVLWKTNLPGRGHGSPTVVGQRLYLATANKPAGTQSMLALDLQSGEIVWEKQLYQVDPWPKIHPKNTHASSTVACDGQRLFVTLYGSTSIHLVCVDLAGTIVWKNEVAKFRQKYPFGYAASPVLFEDLVIAAAESESETALVAYDRASGREVWRRKRPQNSSYSSPILLNVAGRKQLLVSGGREVCSYDPASGEELWKAEGAAQCTAGTVTGEGNLVVASGGYPQSETFCVRADGSAEVLWRNNQKCYEQSLLMHHGYVYAINDGGIAFCWDANTGQEMWKKRLAGPVSASPILVDKRIYVSNELGQTFVFEANPMRYEELAKNQLGDDAFPTPVFLDGRIYARVGFGRGQDRQEMLFCLGHEP